MAISNSVDRFNGLLMSLAFKAPCVVASNVDLTLYGEQTVNGVAVLEKDRVLVTAQTNPVENGIYIVDRIEWTRAGDFDGNRDVTTETLVMASVAAGTPQMWRVSTPTPITIGSTSITWEVFSTASGGGGDFLENVVEDLTPQLGGDLDINTSDITGTGNIDITGDIESNGTAPCIYIHETDQAADRGRWRICATNGSLNYQLVSDDGLTSATAFQMLRNVLDATSLRFFVDINVNNNFLIAPIIYDYGLRSNTLNGNTTFSLIYSSYNVYESEFTGNVTNFFINSPPPSGTYGEMLWKITATGEYTYTWPASFLFAGGIEPSFGVNPVIMSLKTWDGGTTWYIDYSGDYS